MCVFFLTGLHRYSKIGHIADKIFTLYYDHMGFIHKLTPGHFEANIHHINIFGQVSDILHWSSWPCFKNKCHILCTEWESKFFGTNSYQCTLLYVTKGNTSIFQSRSPMSYWGYIDLTLPWVATHQFLHGKTPPDSLSQIHCCPPRFTVDSLPPKIGL